MHGNNFVQGFRMHGTNLSAPEQAIFNHQKLTDILHSPVHSYYNLSVEKSFGSNTLVMAAMLQAGLKLLQNFSRTSSIGGNPDPNPVNHATLCVQLFRRYLL